MPFKKYEFLPKQSEISELPTGAQPIRYIRFEPTADSFKGAVSHESNRDADLSDLGTFEKNNPFSRDKADAIMDARFQKQEATGITIDLAFLKIVTNRIVNGLAKGGDAYLSIYQFIADKHLYETLMSYLEHLSKLKVQGVEEIKQKIGSFQGLTKEQIDLLERFLLERDRYLGIDQSNP